MTLCYNGDMKKFKVIYMGTPVFAQEVLAKCHQRDFLEIVAVVTQPDRKKTKNKVVYSPVKEYALAHQLPLYQPHKIGEISETLNALSADVILTCAYGQFLPSSILTCTPLGVFNFHASLLPAYRGGAPMQVAIMQGETQTGMTLMKSIKKMDAGDIYVQKSVTIELSDTLDDVMHKLIRVSEEIIEVDLLAVLNNQIQPTVQDETKASFAYTINSQQEKVNFHQPVKVVYDHIRALISSPMAYAILKGKRVKFAAVGYEEKPITAKPGTIVAFTKQALSVACLGGVIQVLKCQIEGKEISHVYQLLNGYYPQWINQVFNDEN